MSLSKNSNHGYTHATTHETEVTVNNNLRPMQEDSRKLQCNFQMLQADCSTIKWTNLPSESSKDLSGETDANVYIEHTSRGVGTSKFHVSEWNSLTFVQE